METMIYGHKADNTKVWRGFSALAFHQPEENPTTALGIWQDKEMSSQPVRLIRNPNRQNARDYYMSLYAKSDTDNTIMQGKGVENGDFPKLRYLPALGE